ncbi:MAG: hypothetical protein ABSC77_13980 [Terracidiphilus sp.]
MENGCRAEIRNQCAGPWKLGRARRPRRAVLLLLAGLLLSAIPAWAGETESPDLSLPDAPQPQKPAPAAAPATVPCPAANVAKPATPATGNAPAGASGQPGAQAAPGTQSAPCKPINWFERFLNGPDVKPMTRKEKARQAARNVIDPFNALTILGISAINAGMNAHSPVGPGMTGWGRDVGIGYTEDITGQFFGTFVIPSIVHQDPHYHRMPKAKFKRRVGHAIVQVVWTLGDNGKGMVNYADIVGPAIDGEIANFYVPGQQTNLRATSERYLIGLGLAPTDNFVTEFLPDVARRIHVHDVLIQSIINHIAKTGGP